MKIVRIATRAWPVCWLTNGHGGKLLSVNREFGLPQTKLKDGVRVEVRFLQCDLSGWLLPREFVHDEMVC